jgi:hypothetical protein
VKSKLKAVEGSGLSKLSVGISIGDNEEGDWSPNSVIWFLRARISDLQETVLSKFSRDIPCRRYEIRRPLKGASILIGDNESGDFSV